MASAGLALLGSGKESGGWKKWQIALAIGTPIVIGVGCYFYYVSRNKRKTEGINDVLSKLTKKSEVIRPITLQNKEKKDASLGSLEEKADLAKIAGNKLFKEEKYEEAIKSYSEAISLCPSDKKDSIATFYQNRAAAHEKLGRYEDVIKDCTKAVELNEKYIKALSRRAKAYEHLLQYQNALDDATACCVLEEFNNQYSLVLADKILKKLGLQMARDALKKPISRMPSRHFIKTYFSSFIEDPLLTFTPPEPVPEPLAGFLKARQDFMNGAYDNVVVDCSKDVNDESKPWKDVARLFRATFYILLGQVDEASKELCDLVTREDVNTKTKTNALIKLASLEVQSENLAKAFEYFKQAEDIDPTNTDIFHHRGQVYLLLDKLVESYEDFDKAVKLNPGFAVAAVQKCYAKYRLEHSKNKPDLVTAALVSFKEALEQFPKSSEGHALYAQALTDLQEYQKANDYYDKALLLEPTNANIYVHKGLLQLNWKQDFSEAQKLIEKATKVDNKCEFAFETLGAIEVQRGNLDRAIELFNEALKTTRTEAEMSHVFSLREAAAAQKRMAVQLGTGVPDYH